MPDCAALPSKWFSGYMTIPGTTRILHYNFVESLDKPESDPIIVHFFGGPGCSSTYRMFVEGGPFIMDDGETVIKPNPYPWNERANVMWIESPAGTGFSYASDSDDIKSNDLQVSEDNFDVLK